MTVALRSSAVVFLNLSEPARRDGPWVRRHFPGLCYHIDPQTSVLKSFPQTLAQVRKIPYPLHKDLQILLRLTPGPQLLLAAAVAALSRAAHGLGLGARGTSGRVAVVVVVCAKSIDEKVEDEVEE